MKIKKPILLIPLLMGILFFVNAIDIVKIDTFNNSITSENLSFSGDENISRYLEVPLNSTFLSAVMSVNGYDINGSYPTNPYISVNGNFIFNFSSQYFLEEEVYFNFTNDYSIRSIAEHNGKFWISNGSFIIGINPPDTIENIFYPGTFQNYITLDRTNYIWSLSPFSDTIYEYYIPDDFELVASCSISSFSNDSVGISKQGSNIYVVDRTQKRVFQTTLPGEGCSVVSSFSVSEFIDVPIAIDVDINGTYVYVSDEDTKIVYRFWINGTYTGLSSNPLQIDFSFIYGMETSNNYLYVSDLSTKAYKFLINESFFSNKTNISDFSDILNNAINEGSCDCSGCSIVGDNCSIPFIFHSDTEGMIEYYDVEINYTQSEDISFSDINLTIPSENDFLKQNQKITIDIGYVANNTNIEYCNFTILDPNSSIVINNKNGTNLNNSWSSDLFNITELGNYTGNYTCENNAYYEVSDNFSFEINYYLSYTPINHTLSALQNESETKIIPISLYDNIEQDMILDISAEIEQSANFTLQLSQTTALLNESDNVSIPLRINLSINASELIANGTYSGNISITNSTYNLSYVGYFTYHINPPSGFPVIRFSGSDCSDSFSDACAINGTPSIKIGDTLIKAFGVKNNGAYQLSNCSGFIEHRFEGLNDLGSVQWFAFSLNKFNLSVGQEKEILISFSPNVADVSKDYQGNFGITCQDANVGGNPVSTSPSNEPYIQLNINPSDDVNGGGGGGGTKIIEILQEEPKEFESMCIGFGVTLNNAWEESKKVDDLLDKISILWVAFWDFVFCSAVSSIVPI
jgi:hypothetical protein